jgi:hypothetical protein
MAGVPPPRLSFRLTPPSWVTRSPRRCCRIRAAGRGIPGWRSAGRGWAPASSGPREAKRWSCARLPTTTKPAPTDIHHLSCHVGWAGSPSPLPSDPTPSPPHPIYSEKGCTLKAGPDPDPPPRVDPSGPGPPHGRTAILSQGINRANGVQGVCHLSAIRNGAPASRLCRPAHCFPPEPAWPS